MKFVIATILSATAINSFTLPTAFNLRQPTAIYNARVDTADAIAAALAASKEFGATSKEARIAWETVEEMDSSDNSVAYAGGVTDEECLTDDFSSEACKEYESKVAALSALLEEQKANIENVKKLAGEVKAVKITPPTSISGANSPELQEALKTAAETSDKFGADSTEAKLAWETVEEIASSGNNAASIPNLEDECLVEAMEACEALEELTRVLQQ